MAVLDSRSATVGVDAMCHPELVSGSQTKRSRNKFGMTGGNERESVSLG